MADLLIILVLVMVNGVFSMSEAAVIASRKARLQQQADKGNVRARAALKLADNPNRFLSTVQIGITLIGIVAGAFGGAGLTDSLAAEIRKVPVLAPHAEALGFGLVVALTTYLSLIIGELVPKRLALRYPEQIAQIVAIPMRTLSSITSPLVSLLSASTDAVVFVLGMRESEEPPVTGEEIKAMVQQGVDAGVFVESEHTMVEGVFRLGERRVSSIMTPRPEVTWINLHDDPVEIEKQIVASSWSRFPVGEGDLDHVLGVVHAKDLLNQKLEGKPVDVRTAIKESVFVPESLSANKALELMREKSEQMLLIVGEYGGLQGLVTFQDMLEEIVGNLSEDEDDAVQRDDGSWLLDGMMPVDEMKHLLEIEDHLPSEGEYETLGGLMMTSLGHIPAIGEHFDWTRFRFEVMDMDGLRVDKVLVVITPPADSEAVQEVTVDMVDTEID